MEPCTYVLQSQMQATSFKPTWKSNTYLDVLGVDSEQLSRIMLIVTRGLGTQKLTVVAC